MSKDLADDVADLPDRKIPHLMPIAVVDLFQVIQVDDGNGKIDLYFFPFFFQFLNLQIIAAFIPYPGEGVGIGQLVGVLDAMLLNDTRILTLITDILA